LVESDSIKAKLFIIDSVGIHIFLYSIGLIYMRQFRS